MKRVLIVYSADISSAAVGGIKNYISQLVSYCSDVKVDLLTVNQRDEACCMAIEQLFCFKARFRPMILSFQFEVFKALLSGRIMLNQYDTVVFNRHEDILLLPLIRANRKILIIHGSICYGFKFWPKTIAIFNFLLEKIVIPFMDETYVLLKNSKYGIGFYKRTNPWCADRIHYAPVPIAKEFVQVDIPETKKNNQKLKMVYFGRVVQNPKNVFIFPELIEKFVTRGIDVELTVIGDGPDMQSLRQKINALGLTDRFIFLGAVSHDRLKQLLQHFDLSLVLSDFEGICMSALESLAVGVPVAAFPVGDIPEYIQDMKNGVILSKDESIANNIDKMIQFMRQYKYKNEYADYLKAYYPDNCFSYIYL